MPAGNPVVDALLLLLAVVAIVLAVLGLRHRLAFRIGVRNVRRAWSRTVLLVLGLLVATTIVSGSLVVGDTIGQLEVHYTVLAIGLNDEVVGNQSPTGAYSPFAYGVYTSVQSGMAGNPNIAGMAPMVVSRVSMLDRTTGIPQVNLYLVGVNGNQSTQLGSFVTDQGASLAGPSPGEVLLDDLAASELGASAGNSVFLYGVGATPVPATVQAIVQDNDRGSFPTGGIGNYGTAFVTLSMGQTLANYTNQINFLSVTNVGDQAHRLSIAPTVSAALNTTLATIPAAKGLSVDQLLVNGLASANSASSSVTTLFFVLGLFSIVAGAILIIGIFVLLAEERKGEMGVLRAIGLRGRELVYSFLFEGAVYAAGAALAGTLLGVAVGYGLTYAFSVLFAEPGLTSSAILQSFTFTPESLIEAYVIGFVLTLVTVVIASRRASRLNIVRAIRDLPEPPPTVRTYTYLAYVGAASFALGALLYARTYAGTSDESYPILGVALAIVGIGLIASRFLKNRAVFSAVGAALVVWAGWGQLHTRLLGTDHGGGIFIVFTEGITMVGGALLIYAFNAPPIAAAIVRVAGGRSHRAPVAQVALSYPSRRPARTTVSLAIFALVVFTLVAIAATGATVDASLGSTLEQQSGGYTFVASSHTPIPDLPQLIAANRTVAPYFATVVPMIVGGVLVNVSGFAANPYSDILYAGPAGEPAASNFYTTNQYTYTATENGMSAAQVSAALAAEPDVAVVDQSYAAVTNNLGTGGGSGHPTLSPGASIELTNPVNGNRTRVTVLGIMSQSLVSGVFVGPTTAAALGFGNQTGFFLTVAAGQSATTAAQLAKAAFFSYGLVVVNIADLLASSIASTEAIIGLLQIFVGLGLAVGIAAMGIVALRAVVERRREIGMIRANGFTRGMVLKAFFLEYSFVTLVGIAIGTALGLLIVWNLTQSPLAASAGVSVFAVPYLSLVIFLSLAYGLSMLAVAEPSLRAARLPPAEAVRPTE
ncbi:MAG TPA: FtsX-like permease family protein [Thermoplasmata archaeon]|nr:FtsX-like permease family protein [Thermoplasmata archaeon]